MNPPVQQQPYTQEQINQMLRRMNVQSTHVQGLFGDNLSLEQRQQTLQQLIDGAVTEAITRAQYLFQAELAKQQRAFEEQQALVAEMYREHSMGQLFSQYPELKDYRKFVEDSVAEVSGLPEQPKTVQEFYERVANSAQTRVKTLKPDFALAPRGQGQTQSDPGQGQGQGQPSQAPQPTPPAFTGPTTPPSGGGVTPSKKPAISDIWGDPEA